MVYGSGKNVSLKHFPTACCYQIDTFLITRGYVVIYEPFTDIIHINLLPNMENMYGRRD